MTTTRTPISRPPIARITPEAIAAYRTILSTQGSNFSEYHDACHALHAALGRKPWEECVEDTIGFDVPPEWMHKQGANRIASWNGAREIRTAMEKMIAG